MSVTGTALDNKYYSPEVQAVQRRAVRTLQGSTEGDAFASAYETVEQAAQDVLDILYTAMLFGAFEDYTAQPATRFTIA